MARDDRAPFEWPTLLMLLGTYALWLAATAVIYPQAPVLATVLTGIAIAQHSSLQHELLHGHPFRSPLLNEVIGTPALCLTVPYGRFLTTHLAHHHDPILTDPYDDPESNYFDPKVWAPLPAWIKLVFRLNNTLLGRVTIGPILGNILWIRGEIRLLWQNAPRVRRDWAMHLLGLLVVVWWLANTQMSWWAYGIAAWLGHSLLKIRTFLEHRAHEAHRARTVIIEDRGPLAYLYLFNNLHVVHHTHPAVPWYRLAGLYAENKDRYLRQNEGYVYRSYLQIFRAYLLRAKDPVPHPLMPGGDGRA